MNIQKYNIYKILFIFFIISLCFEGQLLAENIRRATVIVECSAEHYDTKNEEKFQKSIGSFTEKVESELLFYMINESHYQVVERANLDHVLKEHGLYVSDLFAPKNVLKVRKLAGIDDLFLVKLFINITKEYHPKYRADLPERRGDVSVRAIDIKTGVIKCFKKGQWKAGIDYGDELDIYTYVKNLFVECIESIK